MGRENAVGRVSAREKVRRNHLVIAVDTRYLHVNRLRLYKDFVMRLP